MSSVFSSLFIEMSESISFKSKLNPAWVLSVFGVVAVLSKTEQNLKTTEKNLVVFLTFICTLVITPCECKRSFSAMRRLRSWLPISTLTKWLTVLAIVNICQNTPVNCVKVSKRFFVLFPRKITCSSLFSHM